MSYLANKLKEKNTRYIRRKIRSNKKVKENTDEVRVIVQKSNKFISAQAIDKTWAVLVSISDKWQKWPKKEAANAAGKEFAKLLQGKKIETVAFDRNGFLYHGRLASFADGIREWGIKL